MVKASFLSHQNIFTSKPNMAQATDASSRRANSSERNQKQRFLQKTRNRGSRVALAYCCHCQDTTSTQLALVSELPNLRSETIHANARRQTALQKCDAPQQPVPTQMVCASPDATSKIKNIAPCFLTDLMAGCFEKNTCSTRRRKYGMPCLSKQRAALFY